MKNKILIVTDEEIFRRLAEDYSNYIYFNTENLWEVRNIPESELSELYAVFMENDDNLSVLLDITSKYIFPSNVPLVIFSENIGHAPMDLKENAIFLKKDFTKSDLKSGLETAFLICKKNTELKKMKKNLLQKETELQNIRKDVNERLSIEEELMDAVKELETARESAVFANKAKSEFLANMSHEIRTPLNSVIGFTELLAAMISDPQQKSYVDSILLGGKNLLKLINDILDLSKIEAGKMVIENDYFDSYKMFEEIKSIFSVKIAEKGLEFSISVDENFPGQLYTDEVRLRQVLFNIIGNAIKFTETGFIRIEAKAEIIDDVDCHADLKIAIEDSGIGIRLDQQERIFESFLQNEGQSNRKYGGTGLGLAITKRLLEMLNGEIFLTSELDNGSCFEVQLFDIPIKMDSDEEYCRNFVNETVEVKAKELVSFEEIASYPVSDIVLASLDIELFPVWEEIKKSHPISTILEFGESIQELGDIHSVGYLKEYGSRIIECSNNFEIEKIDEYLDFYPELLKRIKRKVLNSEE